MDDAVILAACRTPIGKFQGALSAIPATELGATAIRAAINRSGVDPATIDEVVMGMVLPAGTGQSGSQRVDVVTDASAAGSGATPIPGPSGTRKCPSMRTNGAVMSSRK